MESKERELEVHHYAEYLEARSQNNEWTQLSLAGLAARYAAEKVEYSLDDLKQGEQVWPTSA